MTDHGPDLEPDLEPDLGPDLRALFARDALDHDPAAVDRVVATAGARAGARSRRRRGPLVLAAAAAVLATSVGVWGVGQLRPAEVEGPEATPRPSPAAVPTTTVAREAVALDVPATWADHAAYPCSTEDFGDRTTLVVSDARVGCQSSLTGGPVTTVALLDVPPARYGYDDDPTCTGTEQPACQWSRYYYGATVVMSGPDPDLLRTLMASVRRLPRGSTGVPVVHAGTSQARAEQILEQAGLVPFVAGRSTGATPGPSVVSSVSPLPGTVVATGSRVGLTTTTADPADADAEAPDSVTGTWEVTIAGYRSAGSSEELYDTFRDLDLTLTLRDDGTFTADDGCNVVDGTYTRYGRDLRFYDIVRPDRLCKQDARLWSRLDDIRVVTEQPGGELYLIRDTGAIYLVLRPA